MIKVTPHIHIREAQLTEQFIRAPGPGGQHVNKVASCVQLRFDVAGSALPARVKQRLKILAGRRMGADGTLLIEAKRFRDRERNRRDARERLAALVARAAAPPPPPRRKTRPTRAAKERRIRQKQRRGQVKRLRGRADREPAE